MLDLWGGPYIKAIATIIAIYFISTNKPNLFIILGLVAYGVGSWVFLTHLKVLRERGVQISPAIHEQYLNIVVSLLLIIFIMSKSFIK